MWCYQLMVVKNNRNIIYELFRRMGMRIQGAVDIKWLSKCSMKMFAYFGALGASIVVPYIC